MNILDLMKYRRSIRKYQDRRIERDDLEKIMEAGAYAPNAGGGQRTIFVALRSKKLVRQIGKLNYAAFDKSQLIGSYVSSEQPSIIDETSIKDGFYGAPTVCAIFAPKDFLYSIPDAFCCAENMAIAATELGIASCIIARGEETFKSDTGAAFLREWDIPEDYIARCFVLLGYCEGKYPQAKPRKDARCRIVED